MYNGISELRKQVDSIKLSDRLREIKPCVYTWAGRVISFIETNPLNLTEIPGIIKIECERLDDAICFFLIRNKEKTDFRSICYGNVSGDPLWYQVAEENPADGWIYTPYGKTKFITVMKEFYEIGWKEGLKL